MTQPLAERLRPQALNEVIGQEHILCDAGPIMSAISSKKPLSILLWGPPGCGKTSIARLYAKAFNMHFESMSAIFSGIADLKRIVKSIQESPLFMKGCVLFVDEIHRFNKSQQDAFLPFIEDGTITLVGATAENPSFYLNNALLSRIRVLKLNALDADAQEKILKRYEEKNRPLPLSKDARGFLIDLAQGDGRYLLNLIENIETKKQDKPIELEELKTFLQKRSALFDKSGDGHYNLISALHKSVRGSDPDAALYWFCRILEGGEDPRFLARRLIRMASEDVGLADPEALKLAIAARDAYEMLGTPEGELSLAQVVVYLALAPKSNAIYTAYKKAKDSASKTTQYDPPLHILNAPTKLMREHGYGNKYIYDHDTEHGFSGQDYFPDSIPREIFYQPVERGFEREMQKRVHYFNNLREKLKK